MRKALTALLVGVVVAGTAGAAGADRPRNHYRVERARYDCSNCGIMTPVGRAPRGGADFIVRRSERYIRVEVSDTRYGGVGFAVWQHGRLAGDGCGRGGPFPVDGGSTLTVSVMQGICGDLNDMGVSRASDGTITVTFGDRRMQSHG